jgi:histidine triad (HIT) family protein
MTQEKDCVFCKIINGEFSPHKVYEDNNFLAFMDIHPIAPGHTLVVTKKHYRWVWDVPNAGEYFEITKKIANAIKKAFDTNLVVSKIVGEEVPHAHIWLYPGEKIGADKLDLAGNAGKIKNCLK